MPAPLNHRHVRKITFVLEDGIEETWDIPEGDVTAYYTVGTNSITRGRGDPTVLSRWKEHTLHWTSDRWLRDPPPGPITWVAEKDNHGRATGRRVPAPPTPSNPSG